MALDKETRDVINNLKIASPCPMQWSNMQRTPEEAIRFCGDCRKNVYDVSQMSARETLLLLQKSEVNDSSTCMQLYRRADGTIITDDCPVGLRRIRNAWRSFHSAVATFALLVVSQSVFAQNKDSSSQADIKTTRGRVAVPLGGRVTPASALGGKPVLVDWRTEAMKNASVKKFADQISARETQSKSTPADKLQILRLRCEMALEANKQGVPYFALQELANVQSALQVSTANVNDSAKRKELLKEVLNAKMTVSKKLDVKDTQCIQDELDKLK